MSRISWNTLQKLLIKKGPTLMSSLLIESLNKIFVPVSPQIAQTMQEDNFFLQNSFNISLQCCNEIQLILTNKFLAVAQKSIHSDKYICCAPLSFDLKFQIIYEVGGVLAKNQEIIRSKKIGFKLVKQKQGEISFYIQNQNMMEYWIKYLSKKINQLGFHRMYKPLRKLGKGGFATVYQVERLTDLRKFAVKAFSKQNTLNSPNQNHKINLINEIEMMRQSDSPNTIKLESVYESQNSIYVVLELLTAGQLFNRINKKNGNFTKKEIKEFIFGLVRGLSDLHEKRVMHRDIKPENIMLRSEYSMSPVIVDFGLAANVDSDDYIFYRCGTPGYVAPEITTLQKGTKVEPECDIFSAGVLFHILLTRKPLFEGKTYQQVYDNNRNLRFSLDTEEYKSLDIEAFDLLKKMLEVNPKDRIKAKDILEHPFLVEENQNSSKCQVKTPNSTSVSIKNIFEHAQRLF